jgi:hypothetical protein
MRRSLRYLIDTKLEQVALMGLCAFCRKRHRNKFYSGLTKTCHSKWYALTEQQQHDILCEILEEDGDTRE